MRVKIFLVLLLCALQQVHGSKSTKMKGGSRLKKFFKKCLIALALNYGTNEVVNARNPNLFACRYNVPDQNADVMMNFVKCAKDQDFETFMFYNSENCPKINELYKQVEIDGNCDLNIPKSIFNGALAKLRGEQLSQAANVKMVKEYLLSNLGKDGALFQSGESLTSFLRRSGPDTNFDFFRFANILKLTKFAYPDDAKTAVSMALDIQYEDVNADNAKKLFELTKLAYPNDAESAVQMALEDYKDVNGDNATKLFELTKLIFPDDTMEAVWMALVDYKDVNADKAKKLWELTKLAYPYDTRSAVWFALKDVKDVNVGHVKRVLELTKILNPKYSMAEALKSKYKDVDVDEVNKKYEDLKNSGSWNHSSEEDVMKEAMKVTYPKVVKEDF